MPKIKDKPLKFVFFPPSPWSERARWALDHAGTKYDTIVYTPLVSTLYVRWLSRNFNNKLTIPVAIANNTGESQILRDSLSISLHANTSRLAQRKNLFPAEHIDEINEWYQLSESMLDILRVRANPRMKQSRDLQLNNLPAAIPTSVKPLFLPLSRYALNHFENKYPLQSADHDQILIDGLNKIRSSLEKSGSGYILDQFSYADITTAVIFQAISPCSNKFVELDDATRECWRDHQLIEQFGDLIEWRDNIYEKHRF